ncbi:MAG: DUF4169 family protein [Sphingobium sp.]
MADIINLRLARKAHKRARKETEASENRAKFGCTKAEKTALRAETSRAHLLLDGARRDRKG